MVRANQIYRMKINLLLLAVISLLLAPLGGVAASAAETNLPPRLTVELRDGTRVIGTSREKTFAFHSTLLGEIKLAVSDLRSMECISTNAMKLTAANGDVLTVQLAATELRVQTSFGKVELPVDSIRRISVAVSGRPLSAHSGLLAFWSGDGNADDSVGHHNGVLVGDANFALGLRGQAFNFGAPGSFVKIPKSSDLNPARQVTIEFWMNADAVNAMDSYQGLVTSDFYGVEISNGYGGKMGVNFFISTTANQPGMRFSPNGWNGESLRYRPTSVANFTHISDMNSGGAPVTAGHWHHVAGTYDGVQLRLFIDGQPWGNPMSRPGVIAPMLPDSFIAIGSEDGRMTCPECSSQRYFKGLISDVAIYNRALSAAEIREDFAAGNAN